MTKSELRKARKLAKAVGRPLTGDLALDKSASTDPMSFSEDRRGLDARWKWSRRYDELNGAPEGDWDR